MRKYFELRNRKNEFVGAILIFNGVDENSKTEARLFFISSIEENNWYEEQTIENAIIILKQVAIECENVFAITKPLKKLRVGVFDDGLDVVVHKLLRKNVFKQAEETDEALITTNPDVAKIWSDNSEFSIVEGAEGTGEY